jgi:hypothetical protein
MTEAGKLRIFRAVRCILWPAKVLVKYGGVMATGVAEEFWHTELTCEKEHHFEDDI